MVLIDHQIAGQAGSTRFGECKNQLFLVFGFE